MQLARCQGYHGSSPRPPYFFFASPAAQSCRPLRLPGRASFVLRASEDDEGDTTPPGVPLRVERLLSNLGYGKRRECASMIKKGYVVFRETGQPAKVGQKAVAGELLLDGEPLDPPPPMVVVLHKPGGYVVTSPDDEKIQDPKVYDLLPYRFGRRRPFLSCIGRLDKDTSGLLLLTDDGQLLHRIMSPRKSIWKRYTAVLSKPLIGKEAAAVARRFASGALQLVGDRVPLLPAGLTMLDDVTAEVALCEGRYHQIKRMFATLGYEVVELHRHSIGGLSLGDLPEGEWRFATAEDLEAVFSGPEVVLESSASTTSSKGSSKSRQQAAAADSGQPSSSSSSSKSRSKPKAASFAAAADAIAGDDDSGPSISGGSAGSWAGAILGNELLLAADEEAGDRDGSLQDEQYGTSRRYRDSMKVRRRRAQLRQRLPTKREGASAGS